MTLTDFQFQLGTLVIGTDQICLVAFDGFGTPEPKTQDAILDRADGAVLGSDYATQRVVTLDVSVNGDTGCDLVTAQTQAMTWAKMVTDVWSVSLVDQTLHGSLPGWGVFGIVGRCRGAQLDFSSLPNAVIAAQLTFVAANSVIA